MATATETTHDIEISTSAEHWIAGGVSGLIAGSVFGGIMSHTPMMDSVAALFTLEAVAGGWLLHFLISIVFGAVLVTLVTLGPLSAYAKRATTGAGVGVIFGIVVWAVGAAIIMPLWMGAVTPASPAVPNLNWLRFAGHIAYGVVLGALYPILLAHN